MTLDKTGRLIPPKPLQVKLSELVGKGDNGVDMYEGDGRSFLGNEPTEREGIPGLQTPGKLLIWRSGV